MVPSNTSEMTLRYFFCRLFFGGEKVVTAVERPRGRDVSGLFCVSIIHLPSFRFFGGFFYC